MISTHFRRVLTRAFAGTGFMFSIGNLVISQGSNVKLFDQQSDNVALQNSTQEFASNQNDQGQQNHTNPEGPHVPQINFYNP